MSPEATTQVPPPTPTRGDPSRQPGQGPASAPPAGLQFPEIGALESTAAGETRGDPDRNIDLLKDVALRVKVELGRGKMLLRDVLRLTEGSVVELEKLAGDPLEIYVNDRLVGKGEVLVLNENFCIRITQIFSPEECLRLKGSA